LRGVHHEAGRLGRAGPVRVERPRRVHLQDKRHALGLGFRLGSGVAQC
jgi:hypothetical protein